MAGKPGDAPLNGSDKNENLKNDEVQQEAAVNLSQDAFKPNDIAQPRLEATPEKWDAKTIEASTEALNKMIADMRKKYFEPDHTGKSLMQRMEQNAPDLYDSVAASFTTDLVEPFKQTRGGIEQLMKKLESKST
jgi:hypothetical protein